MAFDDDDDDDIPVAEISVMQIPRYAAPCSQLRILAQSPTHR
jgi:hypothetical protein